MSATDEQTELDGPRQDALARARAFQAAAIEHCNEEGLRALDLISNPEGLLPTIGSQHGLLVKTLATGDNLLEAAVMLVVDAQRMPWPVIGLLAVIHYGDDTPDQLSFFPADSLVGGLADSDSE